MSPLNARAVSIALVAGGAAMVYFSQGLLLWAGFVGWAAFIEAGNDSAAFKKSVAGTSFGALLAWITIVVSLLIPIPDGSLWMIRLSSVTALSLYLLVIATSVPLLSNVVTNLLGYATAVGATAVLLASDGGLNQLTGLHHSNPLIAAIVGMLGGALCGWVAQALAGTLAKK